MGVLGDWDWRWAREICLREAGRVLRDPLAAEDAAQDALLRAWKSRESCARPDAPSGWLAAIARNVALSRRAAPAALETPLPAVEQLAGDDHVSRSVEVLTVRQLLRPLSDEDRRLLYLRYADDLTQAEIARRLGCPPGTVAVRLHRLRRRLKFELDKP
jgi:RNA polymerase sigma-70 factor (ECF subfamily)